MSATTACQAMPDGFVVRTVITRVTMKASVLVAMTTVSKRSAEAWYVALDSRFLCRPVRRLKALCGQCGRQRGCVGVNLCMVVHEQIGTTHACITRSHSSLRRTA